MFGDRSSAVFLAADARVVVRHADAELRAATTSSVISIYRSWRTRLVDASIARTLCRTCLTRSRTWRRNCGVNTASVITRSVRRRRDSDGRLGYAPSNLTSRSERATVTSSIRQAHRWLTIRSSNRIHPCYDETRSSCQTQTALAITKREEKERKKRGGFSRPPRQL